MELQIGKNFPLEGLLSWFMDQKRELPWRRNPSFYEVLISEFMLQQTQVQTVIAYFLRWMELFPSLEHLARAESAAVIKAWEGLGYYSRARNLHNIAQVLVSKLNGLPESYEELTQLKGIGDYTAKAILAFAYQKSEIALDGNVLRVGARFFGVFDNVKTPKAKLLIQTLFDNVEKSSGQMAEALIELGALVCKKKPLCELCPLNKECRAYAENLTAILPVVDKRKKIEKIQSQIVIYAYNQEFMVVKRSGKLMKDLYEFPKDEELPFPKELFLESEAFPECRRNYTRFAETLVPVKIKVSKRCQIDPFEWVDYKKLQDLPFSSGHRKIREIILKYIHYENSTH